MDELRRGLIKKKSQQWSLQAKDLVRFNSESATKKDHMYTLYNNHQVFNIELEYSRFKKSKTVLRFKNVYTYKDND